MFINSRRNISPDHINPCARLQYFTNLKLEYKTKRIFRDAKFKIKHQSGRKTAFVWRVFDEQWVHKVTKTGKWVNDIQPPIMTNVYTSNPKAQPTQHRDVGLILEGGEPNKNNMRTETTNRSICLSCCFSVRLLLLLLFFLHHQFSLKVCWCRHFDDYAIHIFFQIRARNHYSIPIRKQLVVIV